MKDQLLPSSREEHQRSASENVRPELEYLLGRAWDMLQTFGPSVFAKSLAKTASKVIEFLVGEIRLAVLEATC